mgnify:CR=1 FL=1
MEKSITLNEFIIHQQAEFPEATGNFSCLLHHIGIAAKKVNREVNKAGLVDILGRSGCENVQGEEQQKLDVYANEAGHLELQYTARASYALEKAFGAPLGRACGVIVGAPAAVGVLMADTALKSANVDVVAYSSPAQGTSYSNEVILIISGDSGAVRQAVISAREIGKTVLSTLGDTPKNDRPSYI